MDTAAATNPSNPESSHRIIEVDLISALYPDRSLTSHRLREILESKVPGKLRRIGSKLIVRIENKHVSTFGQQLTQAMTDLTGNGVLEDLGISQWSMDVLADLDHEGYLKHLSETLGEGGVSNAGMQQVARAWAHPKAIR